MIRCHHPILITAMILGIPACSTSVGDTDPGKKNDDASEEDEDSKSSDEDDESESSSSEEESESDSNETSSSSEEDSTSESTSESDSEDDDDTQSTLETTDDESSSADTTSDETTTSDDDTSSDTDEFRWSFIGISDSRGGDMGVNSSAVQRIVPKIVELNPDLVIYPGDLSSSGPVFQLEYWLDLWRPVYDAGIDVYPVPGNHEDDSAAWQQVFVTGAHSLPKNGPTENGRTYFVEHENALFLGLEWGFKDSAWLGKMMEERGSDKDHIVVFQHAPIMGRSHSGSSFGPALVKTMREHGAQFFISGHDHMNDHALINDSVHQFIVGAAGAPFYDKGRYDGESGLSAVDVEPNVGENVYGFVYFEVFETRATSTLYYLDSGQWRTGAVQEYESR